MSLAKLHLWAPETAARELQIVRDLTYIVFGNVLLDHSPSSLGSGIVSSSMSSSSHSHAAYGKPQTSQVIGIPKDKLSTTAAPPTIYPLWWVVGRLRTAAQDETDKTFEIHILLLGCAPRSPASRAGILNLLDDRN